MNKEIDIPESKNLIYVAKSRSGMNLYVGADKNKAREYFSFNKVNGERIKIEVWELDGDHIETIWEE